MKMVWFRVYSEIKDDPKMLALTDHQFRIWINLLAMASEAVTRGTIPAFPRRGLAPALHTTPDALEEALQVFMDLEMIACAEDTSIDVLNFVARQYDKPSDRPEAAAERKRQQRDRAPLAEVPATSHGNPPLSRASHAPSRNGHATYVEEERDPEEEKTIPPLPPLTAHPVPVAAASAARAIVPVKKPNAVPKATTGFDFPRLWRMIETQQGYKPAWDWGRETKAVKALLTAHPGAQPADFVRFLAYVGTCWPFSDEPTRQPTFSRGAEHFGAWFTGAQPAVFVPPLKESSNGASYANWAAVAAEAETPVDPRLDRPDLRLIG